MAFSLRVYCPICLTNLHSRDRRTFPGCLPGKTAGNRPLFLSLARRRTSSYNGGAGHGGAGPRREERDLRGQRISAYPAGLLRGVYRAGGGEQFRPSAVCDLSHHISDPHEQHHSAHYPEFSAPAGGGCAVRRLCGPDWLPAGGDGRPRSSCLRAGGAGCSAGADARPLRGDASFRGGLRPGGRPAGGAAQPHCGGPAHGEQGKDYEPAPLLLQLGDGFGGAGFHRLFCPVWAGAVEDHGPGVGSAAPVQPVCLPDRAHLRPERGRHPGNLSGQSGPDAPVLGAAGGYGLRRSQRAVGEPVGLHLCRAGLGGGQICGRPGWAHAVCRVYGTGPAALRHVRGAAEPEPGHGGQHLAVRGLLRRDLSGAHSRPQPGRLRNLRLLRGYPVAGHVQYRSLSSERGRHGPVCLPGPGGRSGLLSGPHLCRVGVRLGRG